MTSLEHCQIEGGTTGVKITSTSTALSDRTTIMGCRFEGNTTNVNITSSNVRETAMLANHAVDGTSTDSGTRTLLLDRFGTTGPNWLVQSSNTAGANGSFRFVRLANGGAGTPAFVLRDDASGTGTPYTLQIETERDSGMFMRCLRGGVTYFELLSTGQIQKQTHRTGAAAPSANANYVGELFVDTTNDEAYIAIQTGTGATDWKKITYNP